MDGQSNSKQVNIRLLKTGSGYEWELEEVGGAKGGPENYPKIKVDAGQGANFKFQIVGSGNVKFKPDPVDALWVKKLGPSDPYSSPTGPGFTDQIKDVQVTPGGKKLTFSDVNTEQVDLAYQLNFEGADPLDPIIENGGGNQPLHYTAYYLIGGAMILAILGFVAYRKFGSQK